MNPDVRRSGASSGSQRVIAVSVLPSSRCERGQRGVELAENRILVEKESLGPRDVFWRGRKRGEGGG